MHQWQAHDHLVLASAVTVHRGKRILVSGGNDDCIAVWDVGEKANKAQNSAITDNGKRPSNHFLLD